MAMYESGIDCQIDGVQTFPRNCNLRLVIPAKQFVSQMPCSLPNQEIQIDFGSLVYYEKV